MNSDTTPLVIVGGGELAAGVLEAARSRPETWHVMGYFAPKESKLSQAPFGVKWLGDDDKAGEWKDKAWFVLGVGDVGISQRRQQLVAAMSGDGVRWATVIHKAAWVSPSAELEPGVVVLAGAVVNAQAKIGRQTLIQSQAVVEHDVVLGCFTQLAPAVAIGGGSKIGAGSFLGLGCRIRDHVELGPSSLVAMGAVVTRSGSGRAIWIGVPAKPQSNDEEE